jgi:predicted amino acid racemase
VSSFPRVVVDLDCLTDNASKVRSLCQEHRLGIVAVTKGVTSDAEIVQAFMRGGIHSIGDSRVHDFLSRRPHVVDRGVRRRAVVAPGGVLLPPVVGEERGFYEDISRAGNFAGRFALRLHWGMRT